MAGRGNASQPEEVASLPTTDSPTNTKSTTTTIEEKINLKMKKLKLKISSPIPNENVINSGLQKLSSEIKHYDECLEDVTAICKKIIHPLGNVVETLRDNIKHANSEMHFAYVKESAVWKEKKLKYKIQNKRE